MILDLLMLVLGLALLIGGGEALVRGAAGLAARLGIGPVVIGLTVVAFGTSTPELVVNLSAAARGDSAIGFGNIVGSNIANLGLLLAITAIAYPVVIHRSIVTREVPMMLLASVATIVLGINRLSEDGDDRFSRGDGVMLLLLFGVFLYYTLGDALRQRDTDAFANASVHATEPLRHIQGLKAAALILGGMALLIGGGEVTVRGAVGFAEALGLSQVIIGLTLVAVGTSLPELATSIIAARRGQTDIAVGNIVGSNIFNLLFIWGLTVTIAPTAVPAGGHIDMLVMAGFAAVLLPLAWTQHRLSRLEGAALFTAYVGYIVWLAMR